MSELGKCVINETNGDFECTDQREANSSLTEMCLRCLAKKRADEKISLIKNIIIYMSICFFIFSFFLVIFFGGYFDDGFFTGIICTLMTLLTYRIIKFLIPRIKYVSTFKYINRNLVESEYEKLQMMELDQIKTEYKRS